MATTYIFMTFQQAAISITMDTASTNIVNTIQPPE